MDGRTDGRTVGRTDRRTDDGLQSAVQQSRALGGACCRAFGGVCCRPSGDPRGPSPDVGSDQTDGVGRLKSAKVAALVGGTGGCDKAALGGCSAVGTAASEPGSRRRRRRRPRPPAAVGPGFMKPTAAEWRVNDLQF